MSPNDGDGMANSVDPDQIAPVFAQAYLSENLGSLRYIHFLELKMFKFCCIALSNHADLMM